MLTRTKWRLDHDCWTSVKFEERGHPEREKPREDYSDSVDFLPANGRPAEGLRDATPCTAKMWSSGFVAFPVLRSFFIHIIAHISSKNALSLDCVTSIISRCIFAEELNLTIEHVRQTSHCYHISPLLVSLRKAKTSCFTIEYFVKPGYYSFTKQNKKERIIHWD